MPIGHQEEIPSWRVTVASVIGTQKILFGFLEHEDTCTTIILRHCGIFFLFDGAKYRWRIESSVTEP
jgi:hypothetical protein